MKFKGFTNDENLRFSLPVWGKYLIAILVFLTPFILLFDLLLPGSFKYILGDSVQLYWPDLSYLYSSLSQGNLPLWDPYERGGDPFWTDPQSALFYPVNYIFILLGMLVDGFPYVLQELRMILHLSIGGLGMYLLLCKGFRLRISSSVIGAVLFILQPYFVGHIEHVLIFSSAWFPFAGWMLLRLREKGRLEDAAWLALIVGLILTAGSPPSAYYALIGVSFFGMATLFIGYGEHHVSWKRFTLLSFGAALVGLMMALPSLVPAMQHIPYSVASKRDFAYLADLSVSLKHATNLIYMGRGVNPEEWMFWGILPIGLALAAFVNPNPRTRLWSAFMWVVVIVFTLILFGRDLPFFAYFIKVFPGAGLFRHPGRYVSVTGFAMPLLAAFGFSALLNLILTKIESQKKLMPFVIVLSTVAVLVWVFVYMGYPMRRMAVKNVGHDIIERDQRVPELSGLDKDWRILDEGFILNGMGDRLGFRDFRGYATNFVYNRWAKVRRAMAKNTELLYLFGIRYYGANEKNYHATVPGIAKVKGYEAKPDNLYQNDNVMPSAFWIKNGCVVATNSEALDKVSRDSRYTTEVVFETADLPLRLSKCEVPKKNLPYAFTDYLQATENYRPTRIIDLKPNHVDMEIEAPDNGWLVVNEAWYPGWVAYVDGMKQDTYAANYFQRATFCPKGRHLVRFSFEPTFFWPTVGIAYLFLMLIIAVIIRSWLIRYGEQV